MVKISFQPITGQKADKEEGDGDKTQIFIPHPHVEEELVLPVGRKRSSLSGLCCLTTALIVFTCSLIYASIYIYRYYIIPQVLVLLVVFSLKRLCTDQSVYDIKVRQERFKSIRIHLISNCSCGTSVSYTNRSVQCRFKSNTPWVPDQSRFHCRVVYEDSVAAPLRGSQELEENVGIYLKENYEQISVPVPDFSNTDPADIIHDFHRGLTAYHDIALDKCYVIELNTSVVMPPRNLWELLINVKKGTYLPQTYIVQEEMVVTGRVNNMHQLGRFIYHLCNGKDTYRLRRRTSRRRITKRDAQNCHRIRHFENTFVVETVICETP